MTCVAFARCLFVPAINCFARSTAVPFPCVFVAMGLLFLLSEGGLRARAPTPHCVDGACFGVLHLSKGLKAPFSGKIVSIFCGRRATSARPSSSFEGRHRGESVRSRAVPRSAARAALRLRGFAPPSSPLPLA